MDPVANSEASSVVVPRPDGPKYSRMHCIVLYSSVFVVYGFASSIIGPTAGALADKVHCEETELGPVFFMSGLVRLIGSVPGGWLADRGPAHPVLGLSLLSEAVAFLFIPKCTSLTCLVAVNSAAAFTFNCLSAIVSTMIVRTDPANFGTWLNFINTLFGAGSMLTPLLATAVGKLMGSMLISYYMLAAAAALTGIWCFTVTAPPQPTTGPSARPKNKEEEMAPYKAPSYWGLLLSAVLLLGLCVGSEVSYAAWIFTYSHKYAHLEVDAAEAVNSTFWAAFTAARIIATLFAAWMHPATMLLLSIPLALLGTALPLALPHSRLHGATLFLCAALVGAGNSTGYANALSLFGHYAPVQGSVMGLFTAAASIAIMLMPPLVAMMARHTSAGYQSVMWVLCVSWMVQLLLVGGCMLFGRRYARVVKGTDELQPLLLDDGEAGDAEAASRA